MKTNIIKIVLGVIFIVTVLIGYIPQPQYLVEMTCISNTFAGILFIADGILGMKSKKAIPSIAYLFLYIALIVVFTVCMGSLTGIYHMNFRGAFFFLHVTNPIAFFIMYFCTVNERNEAIKKCLYAPAFVMLYLLFDFILGKIRGEFVYGFVKPEDMGIIKTILTAIVLYAVFYLVGLVTFLINRRIHRVRE